jgi:hypothetical protein
VVTAHIDGRFVKVGKKELYRPVVERRARLALNALQQKGWVSHSRDTLTSRPVRVFINISRLVSGSPIITSTLVEVWAYRDGENRLVAAREIANTEAIAPKKYQDRLTRAVNQALTQAITGERFTSPDIIAN